MLDGRNKSVLEKVRLCEYKEKFLETVTDVREFQGLLSETEGLKQRIGLSNLEVKRFVRLCESTLNVSIFTPCVLYLCSSYL